MVFSLLATIILIFSKKQNKTFEEQFSKESFIPVRGLLASIIVFTHAWINGIYNNTFFDSLISLYSRAGYLVVSVFFFLSGFGVYESAKRRDHYFDGFIKRESIKIMLPYVLTNIIYIVFRLIKSDTIILKEVLLSFIWPLYNTAAWYVFSVLMIYLILYILIDRLKLRERKLYLTASFCMLCIMTLCYLAKMGSWWYISLFGVVIGLVFSDHKEKLLNNRFTTVLSFLFIMLYMFFIIRFDYFPTKIITAIRIITASIFPLVVCKYMQHKEINLKPLKIMGECSYEIYLLQGLFILYLHIDGFGIVLNCELTSLACVLLSSFSGFVLHKLLNQIRRNLNFNR